jgi:hypothetical protein
LQFKTLSTNKKRFSSVVHRKNAALTVRPHLSLDGIGECVECRTIDRLEKSAPSSILIKNHKTKAEAMAFGDGIIAFHPPQRLSDIVETGYGIFTISGPRHRTGRIAR